MSKYFFEHPCGFCGALVSFRRVTDNCAWWLEPVSAGTGSDYLSTWCADCGARGEHNEAYQAFIQNPRALTSDWIKRVSA